MSTLASTKQSLNYSLSVGTGAVVVFHLVVLLDRRCYGFDESCSNCRACPGQKSTVKNDNTCG